MKVGVIVPLHAPFDGASPEARSYLEMRTIFKAAEDAGLDSAWVTDHLLFRFPPENRTLHSHEAFTIWAGLAEATSRIELGSMVLCTAFRNPAVLAKMAAELDHVAEGRITLGLLECSPHSIGVLVDDNGESLGLRLSRAEAQDLHRSLVTWLAHTGRTVPT